MNILIIDDHQTTLDSLKLLIQSNVSNVKIIPFKCIFDAENYILTNGRVDLVITDLKIEGYGIMDMVEFCCIKNIPCLIFSGYATKSYINEAINKNIIGYVSKTSSNEHLINAIEKFQLKKQYFCPEIQKIKNSDITLFESFKPILTSKEKELLNYLIKGFSMEEITDKMNASIHTLRGYRKNMLHNNKCNFALLSKLYTEWYL